MFKEDVISKCPLRAIMRRSMEGLAVESQLHIGISKFSSGSFKIYFSSTCLYLNAKT
jgi:hypothetical protein